MRLNVSTSIDVTAREKAGDNLLFLGFHGFSNDENEMIRIIDAIYDVPKRDASSTDNSIAPAQHPNYLSFQGTYLHRKLLLVSRWMFRRRAST